MCTHKFGQQASENTDNNTVADQCNTLFYTFIMNMHDPELLAIVPYILLAFPRCCIHYKTIYETEEDQGQGLFFFIHLTY